MFARRRLASPLRALPAGSAPKQEGTPAKPGYPVTCHRWSRNHQTNKPLLPKNRGTFRLPGARPRCYWARCRLHIPAAAIVSHPWPDGTRQNCHLLLDHGSSIPLQPLSGEVWACMGSGPSKDAHQPLPVSSIQAVPRTRQPAESLGTTATIPSRRGLPQRGWQDAFLLHDSMNRCFALQDAAVVWLPYLDILGPGSK